MKRKEYKSVGIIIIAKNSNKILMLHRVHYPIAWSGLAGGIEQNETAIEAIKREIKEEIGLEPNIIQNIQEVGISDTMKHDHHVMVGFVEKEFNVPNLKKDENDAYGWFDENNLPFPLHPGFMKSLDMVKNFLNLKESLKDNLKKFLDE